MKMTSDAKIGLLLGLIFIFIIAFILNGLPGLHGRGSSNQATAQDLSNLSTESFDSPPVQPTGVASGLGAPAWRGNDEVRYQAPLGGTSKTNTVVAAEPSADEQVRSVDVVPADEAITLAPVVSGAGLVEISSEAAPDASDAASGIDDTVAAGTSLATEGSKVAAEYTVEKGDFPAKIALKFYGPEEGNRLVNIDRLMAANNIADETKLKIGQKLVIPALPNGPEKLAVLSPDSFVKVELGPTRVVTADKADDKKTVVKSSGTKEYVVAKGDSPAKIAMKFYGPQEGNRLVNIDRLMAANKITDPTKLKVGQKLVIPALPD
jgi:nucleoid-associated protein YgaU